MRSALVRKVGSLSSSSPSSMFSVVDGLRLLNELALPAPVRSVARVVRRVGIASGVSTASLAFFIPIRSSVASFIPHVERVFAGRTNELVSSARALRAGAFCFSRDWSSRRAILSILLTSMYTEPAAQASPHARTRSVHGPGMLWVGSKVAGSGFRRRHKRACRRAATALGHPRTHVRSLPEPHSPGVGISTFCSISAYCKAVGVFLLCCSRSVREVSVSQWEGVPAKSWMPPIRVPRLSLAGGARSRAPAWRGAGRRGGAGLRREKGLHTPFGGAVASQTCRPSIPQMGFSHVATEIRKKTAVGCKGLPTRSRGGA